MESIDKWDKLLKRKTIKETKIKEKEKKSIKQRYDV